MNNSMKFPIKYSLLITSFSFLGVFLVLLSTSRYGAGVSPDSVSYISTARNLCAGLGFILYDNTPFTLWPPLYPIVLALFSNITGIDPFSLSHIVNAIIFGFVVYLGGMLFFKYFFHYLNLLLALIGIVVASRIQGIFRMLLSEPFFILLVLLCLIFAYAYMLKNDVKSLLFLALSVALACLTRYIGVTLIVWGIVVIILWGVNKGKHKIVHLLSFILISCFPLGLWLSRNYLITETLFGYREQSSYNLVQNIKFTFFSLISLFVPNETMILFFCIVLVFWLFITSNRIFRCIKLSIDPILGTILNNELKITEKFYSIVRLTKTPVISVVLFVVIYLVFLIYSSTTIRYNAIDERLISPIYIPMTLILLITLKGIATNLYGEIISKKSIRIFMTNFLWIWLTLLAIIVLHSSIIAFEEGIVGGYSNKAWRNSQIINYIIEQKDFVSDCSKIYSNGPDALYFLAHTPSIFSLRKSSSLATTIPSESMKEDRFCLVWFESIKHRTYLLSPEELQESLFIDFERVVLLDDGKIFIR